MQVPLLDLTAQNAALETQFKAAFDEVLTSGYYISGPRVKRLEEAVASYTDTAEAIAVSSGTDALVLALMALEIGPGDEVICPSFTFFATAGSVHRLGAKPVFVDCCPVCFNLRVEDVETVITSKTKAIIPVHLFGQAAEMDGLMEVARKHDLAVVEDAAQAIGARYRNRPVGSIGTCGTFSFFPSKNLSGFGEGGMIVTNDADFAQRARILRNHGMEPRYYHQFIGGNFRLDEIQGAMLEIKLAHLDGYVEGRRRNASFYTERLSQLPGVSVADPNACACTAGDATPEGASLVLPVAYEHNEHIWNQYTLRVIGEGRRDALRQHLAENGVASEIYYPVPLHRQECFQGLVDPADQYPVTDQLASEVLSIPVFPELKEEQLAHVVAQIASFLAT